jgi:hypothetical protein
MNLDHIGSFNLDTSYLLASVLWSGIGAGYWIYGKKQRAVVPLFGGIALIVISWVITSAVWMSLTAIAIMFAVYFFRDAGD